MTSNSILYLPSHISRSHRRWPLILMSPSKSPPLRPALQDECRVTRHSHGSKAGEKVSAADPVFTKEYWGLQQSLSFEECVHKVSRVQGACSVSSSLSRKQQAQAFVLEAFVLCIVHYQNETRHTAATRGGSHTCWQTIAYTDNISYLLYTIPDFCSCGV